MNWLLREIVISGGAQGLAEWGFGLPDLVSSNQPMAGVGAGKVQSNPTMLLFDVL